MTSDIPDAEERRVRSLLGSRDHDGHVFQRAPIIASDERAYLCECGVRFAFWAGAIDAKEPWICPRWADGIHAYSIVSGTKREVIAGIECSAPVVTHKACICGASVPVIEEET